MTLYDILGVGADVTTAQIKVAYRQAVKTHHPDVGGDGERFAEVQRAYFILSDPDRRERYDATGIEDDPPAAANEQLAHSMIATLVVQFVFSKDDLNKTDIVAAIRANLLQQKASHYEALNAISVSMKRLELISARMYRSEDTDPALSHALAEKRRELSAAKQAEQASLSAIDNAVHALASYTYRLEPTPAEEARIWSRLKT